MRFGPIRPSDPLGFGYGAGTTTDAVGAFEVPRLPTGDYRISVNPPAGDLARDDDAGTVHVTAPLATSGVGVPTNTFRYAVSGDWMVGRYELCFGAGTWQDSDGNLGGASTATFSVDAPGADLASPLFGAIIGATVLVLAPSAVVAWLAPPNNADVVEYHLPRVMHWIQNRSVGHYPTHIGRQLSFGPGAEYILLQAQILSGGDRLANLMGWFAAAGSVLEAVADAKTMANRYSFHAKMRERITVAVTPGAATGRTM